MSTETTELEKSQDVFYEAQDASLAGLGFKYSSLMKWGVEPKQAAANADQSAANETTIDATVSQEAANVAPDAAQADQQAAGSLTAPIHEGASTGQEELVTDAILAQAIAQLSTEYKSRGIPASDIENIVARLSGCVGMPLSILNSMIMDARSEFEDLGREADQNFDDRLDMIEAHWAEMDRLSEEFYKTSKELDPFMSDETKKERDKLENERQKAEEQRLELQKEKARLEAELDAAQTQEEKEAALKKLNAVSLQIQLNADKLQEVEAKQSVNRKKIIQEVDTNPDKTPKAQEDLNKLKELDKQLDAETAKITALNKQHSNQKVQSYTSNDAISREQADNVAAQGNATYGEILHVLEETGQSNAAAPLTAENKALKQELEASQKEIEVKAKETEARAKKAADEAEAKAAKELKSKKQVAQNDFQPESASLDDLGHLPLQPKAKQKTSSQAIS